MKIMEFTIQQKAIDCLAQIEAEGLLIFSEKGYTIIDNCVVPKSGGKDFPEYKFDTWDVVKTSPDGTYYFQDVTLRHPTFADRLTAGFEADFVVKDAPASWSNEEDLGL